MTKTFSKDYIKNVLKMIGFSFVDGKDGILRKNYGNYTIEINLSKEKLADCKINYGDKISINRETTSNLSQAETLVVLECVDRLLEKGYKPESIELEKDWKLGHKGKGFLDILVKDKDGKSFLMIECKTWGDEYEKEYKKTKSDGGQIFSYYIQEPDTKYLCLYTSILENNQIKNKCGIIPVEEDFKNKNQTEIFEIWNGIIKDNGIFEDQTKPYIIKFEAVKKLVPLEQKDGGIIFNKFAEILRENVVSDKTNAFNKMFNLFLCKIVDEDEKGDDEEKEFQRKDEEKSEDVLTRLNDLYKRGTKRYLNMNIADYSEDEIEDVLSKTGKMSDTIKNMFIRLRLYHNNEFALKEVFDEKSFVENAKIVKAVVKLLENYKLKYTHKNQFLGTFFEKLLNTGIKQEAGQFFTPIPIARFICNSIPFEDIIKDKIDKKEINFLPYVMDYASGSGHFLTEMMDRIDNILQEVKDGSYNLTKPMKDNISGYFTEGKSNYKRAKEFVYGIEKDYRLTKTTKVNCFLNGDGDATIICGDGLGNFGLSDEYTGIVKTNKQTEDNQVFDCVIANPPYSVGGFKNTLKNAKDQFTLYNRLTDNSSEIECLFVERTKQLLKDGGMAGLILPVSILNNGGIYSDTRGLLLKYFDIKGIVELGSNTFMATGTNTIVLFMQRRNNFVCENMQKIVDSFFVNYKDVVCNGIENIFSKYADYVYGLNIKDYIDFVQGKFDGLREKNFFIDYQKYFDGLNITKRLQTRRDYKSLSEQKKQELFDREFLKIIIEKEKEKLLYFVLTYSQRVVVVKSPSDNKEEKDFLGYEFSNRRGNEGIRIYEDENGKIESMLFSEYDLEDKTKASSYLLNMFRGKEIDIDENIKEYLTMRNLIDLIDFKRGDFDKSINTNIKLEIKTKRPLITLGGDDGLCDIKIGGTPSRNERKFYENGDKLWVSISEMNGEIISDTKEKINDLGIKNSNVKLIKAGTTLLSFKLSIGKTAIAGKDLYTNEAIAGLEIKTNCQSKILDKYLFWLFTYGNYNLSNMIGGKAFGKSLNSEHLKQVKIPLPPIEIQEKIIKEMEEVERKKNTKESGFNLLNSKIDEIIGKISDSSVRMGDICDICRGASPRPIKDFVTQDIHGINRIKIGDTKNSYKYIESTREKITKQGAEKSRFVKPGDFLMSNSMSIGKPYISRIDGCIHDGWLLIRPLGKTNEDYLFYILSSSNIQSAIQDLGKGAVVNNLNIDRISSLKIPLPPIEKQKNIVSEIEKLEQEKETVRLEIQKLEGQKNDVLNKYL